MKGLLPAMILVWLGGFLIGGSVFGGFEKPKQPTCQIEFKDPCQEVHGLNTKGIRDYKSKYDRNLKQVVSTCENN